MNWYRFLTIWHPLKLVLLSFYRATACNATHGIAVAILFVRLSIFLYVRLSACQTCVL